MSDCYGGECVCAYVSLCGIAQLLPVPFPRERMGSGYETTMMHA